MKIKICGIRTAAHAAAACEAGADMLGFMFYPPSPRYIAPADAAAITADLPAHVGRVGVFVNETAEHMLAVAGQCGLTALQLHGDEPDDVVRALTAYQVIKAIRLQSDHDLAQVDGYDGVDLLVDAVCDDWGGGGQTSDWRLAARAAARRPIILAGGLTPENVTTALDAVRPAGVDVSSGVEAERGVKDTARIRRFIRAVRAWEGTPA
jgi:phosphoribosylanthranilate isomerase